MSRATARPILLFAALAVAVYALPAFVNDFRAQQFAYVGIYLVALTGLNLLTGYAGQISLGHGAFMAIGGYTTALLMASRTSPRSRSRLSSPVSPASSSASRQPDSRGSTSHSPRSPLRSRRPR